MAANLEKALCDVRQAYRLIYYYQKNILSTVEKFSYEMEGRLFFWKPVVVDKLLTSRMNIFTRWTWDFLPLYSAVFFFNSEVEAWFSSCDLSRLLASDSSPLINSKVSSTACIRVFLHIRRWFSLNFCDLSSNSYFFWNMKKIIYVALINKTIVSQQIKLVVFILLVLNIFELNYQLSVLSLTIFWSV